VLERIVSGHLRQDSDFAAYESMMDKLEAMRWW
jgi:hypothetical protein